MKVSRFVSRIAVSVTILVLLLGILMTPAVFALPAGFQEFYLPLPTGDVGGGGTYSIFNAIEPTIYASRGMH